MTGIWGHTCFHLVFHCVALLSLIFLRELNPEPGAPGTKHFMLQRSLLLNCDGGKPFFNRKLHNKALRTLWKTGDPFAWGLFATCWFLKEELFRHARLQWIPFTLASRKWHPSRGVAIHALGKPTEVYYQDESFSLWGLSQGVLRWW